MSPGTSSSIGISRRRVAGVLSGSNSSPARSTAVLVRTNARNACADLPERNSCTKRSPVLNTTIAPMTVIASSSPVSPDTTASVVSKKLNGLAKARASSAYQDGGFSCATSLRP